MYNFFDFYTNIPKEYTFENFGIEHVLSIITILGLIILCLLKLKKSNSKYQNLIIKICAICVPVLEIFHNIWLAMCSNASFTELLSLHLCGMQMYFIPLAVFTNFLVFKDFVFATSILGGIFAIIFPSGITGNYPLWHFQTLQTFLYHGLLIFVPIGILITTDYRPTIKRFYKVFILFVLIALVALFVDLNFNENYLFLITSPDMPLLRNIQIYCGTFPYLIFTFFALLIICISIHLPFDLYENLHKKEATQYVKPNDKIQI